MTPLREVPSRVQQDVRERAPYLARTAETPVVVAAVEHGPAPTARAIHRSRQPRCDALHPARERVFAMRLDDQMRVVSLERVVRDAEAALLARLRERAAPLAHEPGVAQ